MKIVSTQQIRDLDRAAIEAYKVPGSLLMERAGRGVAAGVIRLIKEHGLDGKAVLLAAGRGNNGGDAFVAARYLSEEGFKVRLLLAGDRKSLRGDALFHFKKMLRAGICAEELSAESDWRELSGEGLSGSVVVDGILGTGLEGKARGAAAAAIRFINALARKNLAVAIDVPSGINSDTGRAEGDVVRADLTLTMGLPKRGLIEQSALEYVGQLQVVDIGFPNELVTQVKADLELIAPEDVALLFPPRPRIAHKGSYGHLLIMGGAEGYSGAMTLAAMGALRSGPGLVSVAVPERLAPAIALAVPEAMVHGERETGSGSLHSSCWAKWKKRLPNFSAILAGPGMTRHAETGRLVKMILRDSRIPVVLDADALNIFEGRAALLAKRECPLVITPHPGEMARLLALSTARVQARRMRTAKQSARLTNATVVLKGAGTLVAEKGRLQINLTGNPGMASGGMGDVLAGLAGGFLAQGLKPFDAARASVYLHGRAGDMAAASSSESSLMARDLIACLPGAFREFRR